MASRSRSMRPSLVREDAVVDEEAMVAVVVEATVADVEEDLAA